MKIEVVRLDDLTVAYYLSVPGSKVVLLQAFFELYEGIATVRTIDAKNSLVCLIVPEDQREACEDALEAIRPFVPWKMVEGASTDERFLGYWKRERYMKERTDAH